MNSQIPAVVEKHLEAVKVLDDNRIILASSNLTGRYWNGSVFWFATVEDAPDIEKCVAGIETTSGIADICCLKGDRVVAGTDTGHLQLFELQDDGTVNTNTLFQSCEHDDIVSSVSVNCDGSRLVSSGYDKCIKVWDLQSALSIATYRPVHSGIIWQVACSTTNPNLLLSCSQDGRILFLDLRRPKPASVIDSLHASPTSIAWNPMSDTAFTAGYDDGAIVVQDIQNPNFSSPVACHSRRVYRLCFSTNNSNWVASCADDSVVLVTDIGKPIPKTEYTSDAHDDFVRGLTWTSDNHLISCGWDKKVIKHAINGVAMDVVNGPVCSPDDIPAETE